ncbi:MAG TPA: FAD-linked oxidase C-terminal domain-containing protein [Bacteroidota bacterium]|nr:FAD-linked oxidase C-terminal domain-containing protein [Bacteroidota bacterium]
MNARSVKRLIEICGRENVFDSTESRIAYSYDGTAMPSCLPDAVVRPPSVSSLSAILRLASEERFGVIPRGSGTSLSGGAIPVPNSIVLLTNHWNRILEIDEQNLTATVEPGVITAQLHQAADRCGLMYPPDPGSSSISTIGGNVAENAGGLRGLKYGVTRNYVLGLEAVLPDGDVLTTGGKSVKDVAGFDLKSVLTGSEGTLAVLTRAVLRLIPKPQSFKTLLASFASMDDAANTVSAVIAARITPAMIEFLDQTTIRCVEAYARLGLPVDAEALLLIEVDGHAAVVDEDVASIRRICERHRATSIALGRNEEESARLKAGRRAAFASLARICPTTIMEDVAVPRAELARLVGKIETIGKKYSVRIGNFGHAGDGNLHPNYLTDDRNPEEFARAVRCVEEVELAAIDCGGTITGEHGVGLYKREMLKKMVTPPSIRLMQQLKQLVDPENILNPGKVIETTPRCEGKLPRTREQIGKYEDVAWH